MQPGVRQILNGLKGGRVEPADLAQRYDIDPAAAAAAVARWQGGRARGLEGLPVAVGGAEAQAFAEAHGAIPTGHAAAPLAIGGDAGSLVSSAQRGDAALDYPEWPLLRASDPAELLAVVEALGHHPAREVRRIARIGALQPRESARRKGDDLAASLAGGLGAEVSRLAVDGADRMAAAAAAADAVLVPLDPGLAAEAAAAGLALVAVPGAWGDGGHVGLGLAGRDAAAITHFAVRLDAAMGGGQAEAADED